jgi:27-O-demethylrifamycin SV methyltransferase
MSTFERPDPRTHYDRLTDAWRCLLGEDLHYGYFTGPDLPVQVATQALTELMASKVGLQKRMSICGTGNPAVYLAREYGCRVLGIVNSAVGAKRATVRETRQA